MPKNDAAPLSDHHAIASGFYEEAYRDGDKRLLLFNNGDFFWYHNPHWQSIEGLGVRTELWNSLATQRPKKTDVDGAMDALRSVAYEPVTTRPPCWLVDFPDQPPASRIIACNNGLLDLDGRSLMSLTPDFFNLNYLPIDYQPEADAPEQWLKFLSQLWPEDQPSIDCLQEIFGYILTLDTSQHKMFLLIGPKRSGKSTIARILTALVGHANVCNPTLSGLVSTAHGAECLIGTQVAIIGDARLGPHTDHQATSEILLGISGEDNQTIQRKYKTPWTGRLNTRFLILTNEVPALSDASGALAGRLIALETQESFYGREDLGLEKRLMTELHGILHWSLAGLDRLRKRGYFNQPKSGEDLMDELRRSSSPMTQFVEDECEIDGLSNIECGALFEHYAKWCGTQNRKPGTVQRFGRDLKAAVPTVRTTQPCIDGNRERFFDGIKIRH